MSAPPPASARLRLRHRLRAETGQTLVIFALALPVMLGLCAIVIDFGNVFVQKRSLQQAADAAALAAAQGLPGGSCDSTCEGAVASLASNYSGGNGAAATLPACTVTITKNCYTIVGGDKVRVILSKTVNTFFGGLFGKPSFTIGAKAAAGRFSYTTTTPGTTDISAPYTYTSTTGGYNTAIFARAQICSSFFFPGSGNHISGVSTFGGVGNFGTNNTVDAIKMNHTFYNQNGCSYPSAGSGAPTPPEFWCYNEPGHVPCDGVGAGGWPVPFPGLGSLGQNAGTRCLYTSDSLTAKALTGNVATMTSADPNCLHVGDRVTVAAVDNRFDCTNCAVTAATANTFSYAKALAAGTAKAVSTKALQSGVATLTTAVHGLNVGDVVTVAGVDSTFNGTYTVTAVPSTTTFSYAKTISNVDLNVTTKAMTAGVATLTTSVAHRLTTGDSVTVSINDARYDGTYTVASVPTATTFTYTPAPVTYAVTNKVISGGVATLTTSAAHGLVAGNTVVVNVNDPRYDGTFTVAAPVTGTTFSYASPNVAVSAYSIVSNVATLTATTPPHGLAAGNTVTISGFAGGGSPTYLNGGPYTVTAVNVAAGTFSFAFVHANAGGSKTATADITSAAAAAASGTTRPWTIASGAASGTVNVPGFVASTASGGTVTFTGTVAQTAITGANTVTQGALANATIANGWTASNPKGIYMVDAGNGVSLTITATNTDFTGYTFVAPEILISGGGNTFSNYTSADQAAVFYAYDPSGDAVRETAVSTITGSIFCGPENPPAGSTSDPTNKCWFGGDGTTFQGLMQAWRIEWKLSNADFNGTGPPIGGTTSTTTVPGTTTINDPVTNTVGTGSNLDE